MKKVFNYKAEKKEWKDAIEKELNKVSKKVRIDGFRPGKAPKNMVMKKYGADVLIDAANALINKEYTRIITEEKIVPITEPRVNIVKSTEEELEIDFTFITEPEVKLGKYKDLDVKKDKVKVSKEDIEQRKNTILNDFAELVIKEKGSVKKGDIAIIDFEGFKDGVAFEGGKGENYSLEIGSNTFIPGFEDGIIGMKKGEEKDLNLTFPDNYGTSDLAGAEVVFKVKVNEIKERVIPELDEEFFKDLNMDKVTNKEEFETKIKEDITKEREKVAEDKYTDELLKEAVNNMECEIDDEIILDEAKYMYEDMMNNMASQGLTEEIYLKYANTTKDKILENLKKEALRRLNNSYLLKAIIKKEKIETSDEDLDKEIDKLAKEYNLTNEELLKNIGNKETLRFDMNVRRAIEIMKGNK